MDLKRVGGGEGERLRKCESVRVKKCWEMLTDRFGQSSARFLAGDMTQPSFPIALNGFLHVFVYLEIPL